METGERNEGNDGNVGSQSGNAWTGVGVQGMWEMRLEMWEIRVAVREIGGNEGNQGENLCIGVEMINKKCREG